MIRYVTPAFLLIILVAWTATKAGGYLDGMNPAKRSLSYERAVYVAAVAEHFEDDGLSDEELSARTEEILGPDGTAVDVALLPDWLQDSREEADTAREAGPTDANVARFVFIGILVFFLLLTALGDIACRNHIGQAIEQAEGEEGVGLEGGSG
jgi:hypothetical protein